MRRNRLTALAALLVLGVPATARAQTFWDFVALNNQPTDPTGAGPDYCPSVDQVGNQPGRCTYTNGTIAGNDNTVTKAGFGTVGFNAVNGQPAVHAGTYLTVFQWFANQAVAGDEKGVGVCRTDDVGATNGHSCAPGAGGEVGESNSGAGDAQWLVLDLTLLTPGSILNSVTLASLTSQEAWHFLSCSDAGFTANCHDYAGNSSANILQVNINSVDQSNRWLRFTAGAGLDGSCAGPTCHGDYLVQGISTTTTPEPGTMVLLATGLVGLAGAGTLRRRKRNQ